MSLPFSTPLINIVNITTAATGERLRDVRDEVLSQQSLSVTSRGPSAVVPAVEMT